MLRIYFLLICLFTLSVSAQNNAIIAGEKLIYTASYNMSGILNDIAQVTMETSTVKTSSTSLLRLKCTATTYSKWDSFFKIRDLYESYVSSSSITPYLYKRDINEGGYTKFMEYTYNQKNNTVKSLLRKKAKHGGFYDQKKNFTIDPNTKDIVATLYKIRTLDFSKAPIGKTKSIKVLFDNKQEQVTLKYLGTETISTSLGKKLCHKIAIATNTVSVLEGNDKNLIWLTADDNRIPVYAKFKIPVGNGELKIQSASGLRN